MVAFRAELQFDGEKTPESVAAAMQEVLDAGIPGDARLSFVNGPNSWTVTATWIAEAAPEQQRDYRVQNLEAIREQLNSILPATRDLKPPFAGPEPELGQENEKLQP